MPSPDAAATEGAGLFARAVQMLDNGDDGGLEPLTRAANLLRTRIDVEIEQQNRDLLAAMSERARMQLRLQQTVEGLSVAAISYYVASLLHYVFESAEHYMPVSPTVATGISIPFVVIALTAMLWRVKRSHGSA